MGSCLGKDGRQNEYKAPEPQKVVPYSEIERAKGYDPDNGHELEFEVAGVHSKVLAVEDERAVVEDEPAADLDAEDAEDENENAENAEGEEEGGPAEGGKVEGSDGEDAGQAENVEPAEQVAAQSIVSRFEKGEVGEVVEQKETVKIERHGIAGAVKNDRKVDAYHNVLATHI